MRGGRRERLHSEKMTGPREVATNCRRGRANDDGGLGFGRKMAENEAAAAEHRKPATVTWKEVGNGGLEPAGGDDLRMEKDRRWRRSPEGQPAAEGGDAAAGRPWGRSAFAVGEERADPGRTPASRSRSDGGKMVATRGAEADSARTGTGRGASSGFVRLDETEGSPTKAPRGYSRGSAAAAALRGTSAGDVQRAGKGFAARGRGAWVAGDGKKERKEDVNDGESCDSEGVGRSVKGSRTDGKGQRRV